MMFIKTLYSLKYAKYSFTKYSELNMSSIPNIS